MRRRQQQQQLALMYGGGFTPADLANLALWLKADAGTYQAAGGAAAVADGDPVGQWQDQSGNTRHAAQVTSTAKPTLKLAQVNGRPALSADGGDILSTSAFALAEIHVFVILKIENHLSVRIVLEHSTDTNDSTDGFWLATGATGGGAGTRVNGTLSNQFVPAPSNNWWNDGSWVCAEIRSNASGIKIYKNGTLGNSSAIDCGNLTAQSLYLFARAGNSLQTIGLVAEAVLCSSVQAGGDITNLYDYFSTRYGITFP